MPSQDEEPIIFDVADDQQPAKAARPTSSVEILHPLARWEQPVRIVSVAKADVPPNTARRLSWLQRSLLAGGAVGIIAFIFMSGMYLGSYWPTVTPVENPADTVAGPTSTYNGPDDRVTAPDDTDQSSLVPDENSPSVFDESTPTPTVAKHRHFRRRATFAAYRPRFSYPAVHWRPRLPKPQFWVSNFVPTTLFIFVENGVVKTRIEPWTRTDNK